MYAKQWRALQNFSYKAQKYLEVRFQVPLGRTVTNLKLSMRSLNNRYGLPAGTAVSLLVFDEVSIVRDSLNGILNDSHHLPREVYK